MNPRQFDGSVAIVIPARYGSTRFPGKPLCMINGHSLLERVCKAASAVRHPEIQVLVATDDERIMAHALDIGARAVMTPSECPSGTDRVSRAIEETNSTPDIIVNLQGDAPFISPRHIEDLIESFVDESVQVATPVHALSWNELDRLREEKRATPFSGTTAIVDSNGFARWFSKAIIPAIRNEQTLRKSHDDDASPVFKHLGLYAYRRGVLERFVTSGVDHYEAIEGLEQLRFIKLGITIKAVQVMMHDRHASLGIDTEIDRERAESLLEQHGEPHWME